jgi:uncharacterized damage-inducible protein DinB
MPRPDLTRVPDYFHNYINQTEGEDLLKVLCKQTESFLKFLDKIPKKKRSYRYAEGKWTIKEVLQHIIDAERVFAYRALCIARKDATPLPSFDDKSYAENCKAEQRKWKDMVNEFIAVRLSTESLFASFDDEQLETSGTASGKSIYVAAIGFIVAGHANHHSKVVKEKYMA